jgi:hypothetical protein
MILCTYIKELGTQRQCYYQPNCDAPFNFLSATQQYRIVLIVAVGVINDRKEDIQS